MRIALALVLWFTFSAKAQALPIFDAHMHYSHDAWDVVPVQDVLALWRKVFMERPDRFMVGTDMYTPERCHYVPEHASWSRAWLSELPRNVAEQIAWKNGERLFGSSLSSD